MMPKQLGEFLQQQQEPFILEVYLLERGYQIRKNKLSPENGFTRSNASCLKRSATTSRLKGNRKFLPNCSRVVRALLSRLVTVNNEQKIQNSGSSDQNSRRQEIPDENFSSASSTTVFNSCSENDAKDAHCSSQRIIFSSTAAAQCQASEDGYFVIENEAAAGWNFKWRAAEDCSKQLSPVSVLEDTESQEGSPPVSKTQDSAIKTQQQLLASVSICKSKAPIYSRVGRQQDSVASNVSSQYSKNKKAVQQTKQLLFDCVREVVEKHKKNSGRVQQFQEILGAEKLWELICENLWLWSKESINETNITRLLHLDALSSGKEWEYFEQQKQEIVMQLGEAILEDIGTEIMTDIISIFS